MRLPVGTIYNVLVPIGGPDALAGGESAGRPASLGVSLAIVKSPGRAPEMTAPGRGTYDTSTLAVPYSSSLPSVPSLPQAPIVAAPFVPMPSIAPPTVSVSTLPSQVTTAHDKALLDATKANVSAGMTPDAALQKANADQQVFYNKLQNATPQQVQQFVAMSDKIAADEKAKAEEAFRKLAEQKVNDLVAQGVDRATATARVQAESKAFFDKLNQASAQQINQFQQFSAGVSEAEAAKKNAEEAARKLEADTAKKAAELARQKEEALRRYRPGVYTPSARNRIFGR